jgi:GNAT superfamily N-acetyltransferase
VAGRAPAAGARQRPPAHSSTFLEPATLRDAGAITALRNATSVRLTEAHGEGPWSRGTSERGVRFEMTRAVLYVVREDRRVVATLALSRRKPWAIDPAYFTPARAPLYLTGMAVAPGAQRGGVGRRCMRELPLLVRDWQADAIRLDAYDAAAGAGGFYAACGLREVGRVNYRGAPLVYFEWVFG